MKKRKKCKFCGRLVDKKDYKYGLCFDCYIEYCEMAEIVNELV